jgi:hypothetical protein
MMCHKTNNFQTASDPNTKKCGTMMCRNTNKLQTASDPNIKKCGSMSHNTNKFLMAGDTTIQILKRTVLNPQMCP